MHAGRSSIRTLTCTEHKRQWTEPMLRAVNRPLVHMSPSRCLLLRAQCSLYHNIPTSLALLTSGTELQVFHTNHRLCGPFAVVSCNSKICTHTHVWTHDLAAVAPPIKSHAPFITPGSLILSSTSLSEKSSTGPASVYAELFRNLYTKVTGNLVSRQHLVVK